MFHLVLMLPVFGLVLFLLLPLSTALPLYLVILVMSAILYFVLMKALNKPVATGKRGLVGKLADVIDMTDHQGQVRVQGTTWEAESDDSFASGDKARIVSVDGLTLKVERVPSGDLTSAGRKSSRN